MRRTRLPNHFGSIRYLGAGRRNAYAVNVTVAADEREGRIGNGTRRKAICYTRSWEEGYQVLVLFHAGVITVNESPKEIREKLRQINSWQECTGGEDPRDKMVRYAKKILVDLDLIRSGGEAKTDWTEHTFRQVYHSFIDHRFGPNAGQKRKASTKNGYTSAWLKLEPFYGLTLDQVSVDALEARVNTVARLGYSKTTVQRMVTLIHQLYKYAYDRGYCEGRHGLGVEMPAAKEEVHHQDFSDKELAKLWVAYQTVTDLFIKNTVRMILIMCYSGFRIKEYETLEFVDGEIPYLRGGLKTAAGKNRVVPVHSMILPLVRECEAVFLNGKKNGQFRRDMKMALVQIGVDDPGGCHKKCYGEMEKYQQAEEIRSEEKRYHTPHSTRHTFSRLCESYDVREADRKRMMGHSLKGDVTNGVYGHRSVAELSREVEKIEHLNKFTISLKSL